MMTLFKAIKRSERGFHSPHRVARDVNRMIRTCACIVGCLLLIITCSALSFAQQPESSPAPRTGRSYSVGEAPKNPPPPGPQAPSPVTFSDISGLTKINFKHAGSPTPTKYLLETMGGGVAMLDFDNDGLMDLFFTNGAVIKESMNANAQPDKRQPQYWNRLYKQKPDGSFEDVTERARLQGEGYSMGVAAADFDNDGFTDLYVTGYGANHLYRNNADGTFTDVTNKLGVGGSGWSTSAGWFDYDRDGRLDLFVARYLDWNFDKGAILCGDSRGTRAYCHPDNFKGVTDLLFHQLPDGTFKDVSATAGLTDPSGKGLGVAFADFDGDGFVDVFVADDSVRQTLYHNKRDGTFEDIALLAGAGYDEDGKTFAGMGVDAGDYDNDGFADVIITTLSYQTYPLYKNNGDLSFTYVSKSTGVGAITLPNSGWGVHFIDVDNDGLRDIFVAQSHVLDTIELSTGYLKYKQTPLLMRNTGKGFTNISATAGQAFTVPLVARAAAFGDLNNDGQVDAVLGVLNGAPVILRNNGTSNHWLGIQLTGQKSDRNGIGARVIVTADDGRKQTFEVTAAGSYLSSNDWRIIAGLGRATAVKTIEVRWPSGIVQTIGNPKIDRYLKINEPDPAPK